MTRPILQSKLRDAPWRHPATARLPGIQPMDMADWLVRDDAYAAQMAERDRLLSERENDVTAMLAGAEAAVAELIDLVLTALRDDGSYRIGSDEVTRPDGVSLEIDTLPSTLARLSQCDFCVMERDAAGVWRLTAAALCFPASWTLDEKIGRGLPAIHRPVQEYDEDLARRVNRLFDAIRPEQPLWRVNALRYTDPALFQPRAEAAPRVTPANPQFLRSERQTLRRLPRTGAVAFGIHTTVLPLAALAPKDLAALRLLSEE